MRVAHIVPRGERATSGVFTVLVELSVGLARRGHDVAVWSLLPWTGEGYGDAERLLEEAGVARRTIGGGTLPRAARSVAEAAAEVDIVHLHGAFNLTNAFVSSWLTVPYVFSPHGGYHPASMQRSRSRKQLYLALVERRLLRRAATIAALTSEEERDVRALGVGATPVVVIPNGVRRPAARRTDAAAFRRSIGVGIDDPLVVFVGRLDVERKGLDRLLRGLSVSTAWRCALIGPEERGDLPRIEHEIGALGLTDRVTLCGPMHGGTLDAALASADLFALLSRWEGLPLALLEALACGTPALVSEEVEQLVPVADRGAGWAVPPGAVGPTLDAIARNRVDLQERARSAAHLADAYDWVAVADTYAQVYTSIVATSEGKPRRRRILP